LSYRSNTCASAPALRARACASACAQRPACLLCAGWPEPCGFSDGISRVFSSMGPDLLAAV